MKKILILAYDFPPLNSVGTQRPKSWFSYFEEYGLSPVVVTINWEKETDTANNTQKINSQPKVITVPLKKTFRDQLIAKYGLNRFVLLRKTLSFLYSFFQYLPTSIGDNKYYIYRKAKKILEKEQFDVIIATGEPYILFKYAYKLSKSTGLPWFADYRDDWINNHIKAQSTSRLQKILTQFESIKEKKYLSNVSGVSSVSEKLVSQIQDRINSPESIVIENGIDLNHIKNSKQILDKKNFNIVYTGILYDCDYISTFIEGFKLFLKKCNSENIQLLLVGCEYQPNKAYHKMCEFSNENKSSVKMIDRVDPQMAVNYQVSSNVLVNFIAGDPSKGLIGAKAYSYAATKKPILAIPHIPNKNSPFFPDRDIQTIATTPEEVCEFLIKQLKRFQEVRNMETSIKESEIFTISRQFQTKKLANFILNQLN